MKRHLRPSYVSKVNYNLRRLCEPLHALPLTGIDRRTIASHLAVVAAENGPGQANAVRVALSAFFSWTIAQGLLDSSNPVTGTTRQPQGARERVLSMPELVAIWQLARDQFFRVPSTILDWPRILHLLMLTGAREGEIGGLRWSEIFDDCIIIPGARTKNKRQHTIPITAPIAAILAACQRREGNDQIFGRLENRPFDGWSGGKKRTDAQLGGRITGGPWVIHDLRRSVATHLAERDISPHIIEAILNHASGHKAGVAGVYNRATYEPQIRHALTMWGEHLLAAVEGKPVDAGKVVSIR